MQRDTRQIHMELLVLYAQGGDAAALDELVKARIGLWRARARAILGSATEADDAVQDTCMTIARSISKLDDPAAFTAWSNRILSRRCADIVRKIVRRRKTDAQAPRPSPAPTPAAASETSDETSNLMRAMDDLPPEQRMIVVMHYLEDKPLKLISRITRVPIGTLKSRLFTARKTLAAVLEPTGPARSKP